MKDMQIKSEHTGIILSFSSSPSAQKSLNTFDCLPIINLIVRWDPLKATNDW